MIQETFEFSHHARQRMAQRNVSMDQISFILEHGHADHCAGAILVTLRRKDIPKTLWAKDEFARLEGVTVVLSREVPVVQTVWRNRQHGLRHIRHKPRYTC
jgi:metal-dependent hydrolase (beta-lactamase superfamily II)